MKTAKLTINDIVYNVDVFPANDTNLSTDIKLTSGNYNLSKIEIYDGDKLIEMKDVNIDFKVDASFPSEIPVDLISIKKTMTIKSTSIKKGGAYVKLNGMSEPEEKTLLFTGTLGIKDIDFNLYQKDDIYRQRPITNKVKLKFSVAYSHNGDSLSDWEMYDWHGTEPIKITYTKSNDPNDLDIFVIQMYAVLEIDGERRLRDFNQGINGDLVIKLRGDEDPILNDEGMIEIDYLPGGWESNLHYHFVHVEDC